MMDYNIILILAVVGLFFLLMGSRDLNIKTKKELDEDLEQTKSSYPCGYL